MEALKKITEELIIPVEKANQIEKTIKNISDFKKTLEKLSIENISDAIEIVLAGGFLLGSSDIHFEPEEEMAKIRVRIDGLLQDVALIDLKLQEKLTSRIKLLSGIKLNITDRPQDGRFSVLIAQKAIYQGKPVIKDLSLEIRTSTLPAEYGESIVLRILNPRSLINLDDLGLRKDLFQIFEKEIRKPNGMIIITGPTGSGKTTTLYAFLKKIQKPEIKIITVEDPIEYHLEGISQTQVAPEKGYNFANGLQSIMRQDPDVILVGEIRDLETASIALQAALTGHLVLTTLHTNDAAGTIARLQSLGEKPVNIAPAINMAVAQRLVRKVCQKCAESKTAPPQIVEKIKRGLKGLPKGIEIPKMKKELKVLENKGCKECNFTGFKGRIGIYEVILIDDEMEKFILTKPSISALKKEAIKKGMVTMYQDALIKVLQGLTTLEEAERVIGEE